MIRLATIGVLAVAVVAGGGCGGTPRPDVEKQIRLLEGGDEEGRWEAVANLRRFGAAGEPAVEPLRALLRDTKDADLQSEIARALAGIGTGSAAAVPELVPLLSSKDSWVKVTAAEALGTIGAASAPGMAKLERLTKDPDADVAAAATAAIRRIQRSIKSKR